MKTSEALRTCVAEISQVLATFEDKDSNAKQLLGHLAVTDPGVFFAAGIRVVATTKPSDGSRFLISTLAKDKRFSLALLDSAVCSLPEALTVTRAAADAGSQLQSTFEMALNKALQGQASPEKAERIIRILDLLAVTCDHNCWNSFQVELMAYPDKIVRAKAALLIGRGTRNVGWIARRLLDRDPRVQASAVEALWGLDAEETKPHFLSALKSTYSRVAGNAALGLYRSGDVSATRVLLDMLRHNDVGFRLSGLWAIGETYDERFLPALADYYKHAEGKLRLATVGAMSKIRRGDKSGNPAGSLQIRFSQAALNADGVRRLALTLSCHPARDLSGIKPTEFAVWENGTLIEDYKVRLPALPPLLTTGFILPWCAASDDPQEISTRQGLKQCLSVKRGTDPWRIDRYTHAPTPPAAEKPPGEKAPADPGIPYDDALLTPELKAADYCAADLGQLTKLLDAPVPSERAAADPLAALQRQCDVFAKRGGKRHIFLMLSPTSGFDFEKDDALNRLRGLAQSGGLVIHAVAPGAPGKWPRLRDACLACDGSFTETPLEDLAGGLVDAYSNLCAKFEISYSAPSDAAAPIKLSLKISSGRGQGEAEISLAPPVKPPPPPVPQPAQAAVSPVPEQAAPAA